MDEWLNWDQVNHAAQGRLIVCFGAGNRMQRTLKYLARPVAYIVDNNPYEQDQVQVGITVKSPEVLRDEPAGELFVIITSVGFPDIVPQLESYGLHRGEHFCVSPALRDFEILSRIQAHEQTIYLTCSDPVGQGGGFYRFEIPDCTLEQVFEGHCHGAAVHGDWIYVVDDSVCGVRVLDRDFQQERVIGLPSGARPHGIAISPDGETLYIAFCGQDCVQIYVLSVDFKLSRIGLSDKYASIGLPEHHLNDLCAWKDRLYLTVFSRSGNWKRGVYDGAVLEVDLDHPWRSPSVVVDHLKLPHTPTIIEETLHFCESLEGRVWAGTDHLVCQFNGFVRGIAHDGLFYYVGQSQHRHITRRLGASNISLDTGVFLVDDETKCTKFFPTPSLTDINTVLFVPQGTGNNP